MKFNVCVCPIEIDLPDPEWYSRPWLNSWSSDVIDPTDCSGFLYLDVPNPIENPDISEILIQMLFLVRLWFPIQTKSGKNGIPDWDWIGQKYLGNKGTSRLKYYSRSGWCSQFEWNIRAGKLSSWFLFPIQIPFSRFLNMKRLQLKNKNLTEIQIQNYRLQQDHVLNNFNSNNLTK